MSLLMDALRQSEKFREKTRRENEAKGAEAGSMAAAPELALEPAQGLPEHLALALDDGPDTDVVDDPALTHELKIGGDIARAAETDVFTAVTAGLKTRRGLNTPWLPAIIIVLSAAGLVASYELWRGREDWSPPQPSAALPADLEPGPAPTPTTRTAQPLIEEPETPAPSAPARREAPVLRNTEPTASGSLIDGEAATDQRIEIRHKVHTDADAGLLNDAYADYQAGRLQDAAAGYEDVLERRPRNRDALLGLAAIALREGDTATAQQRYRQVLEFYPGDTVAASALMDLSANTDADETASTLKYWLQGESGNAALQFALGNQYARAGNWRDAQEAYFQACAAAPDNADYVFNLAISLDHLDKPALAVEQYRRALSLAGPSAAFDRQAAARRVAELTAAAGSGRP